MPARLPYLKVFTLDRLAETRSFSPDQKALYWDLQCYAHQSPRRGYLQKPTGKAYSHAELALMTGFPSDRLSQLMQELIDAGAIVRAGDEALYVPWIVREEQKRQLCGEAGKRGGSPTLKGLPKGSSKGGLKGISEYEYGSGNEDGKKEGEPGGEGREGLRAGLVAEFQLRPVTAPERDELEALIDILQMKGAHLRDIHARRNRYRAKWPAVACTPRALVRWWDLFAAPTESPVGQAKTLGPLELQQARQQAQREAEWLAKSPEERESDHAAALAHIHRIARGHA